MRRDADWHDGPLLKSLAQFVSGVEAGSDFIGIDLKNMTGRSRDDDSRTLDVLFNQGGAGFFPLCIGGVHWAALCIASIGADRRRYLGYFDPLGWSIPAEFKSLLEAAVVVSPGRWVCEWRLGRDAQHQPFQSDPSPPDGPGQYQCGVWCLFAEELFLRWVEQQHIMPDEMRLSEFMRQHITGDYSDLIASKRQVYKRALQEYKLAHPTENYDTV